LSESPEVSSDPTDEPSQQPEGLAHPEGRPDGAGERFAQGNWIVTHMGRYTFLEPRSRKSFIEPVGFLVTDQKVQRTLGLEGDATKKQSRAISLMELILWVVVMAMMSSIWSQMAGAILSDPRRLMAMGIVAAIAAAPLGALAAALSGGLGLLHYLASLLLTAGIGATAVGMLWLDGKQLTGVLQTMVIGAVGIVLVAAVRYLRPPSL
jgi:hypothetical protein